MKIEAVIYDHDGTLVNSEKEHYHVWRKLLLEEFEVALSEQVFRADYTGLPTLPTAEAIVERFALDIDGQSLFERKMEKAKAHFAQHPPELLPGVVNSLDYLAQVTRLAVATGASRGDLTHSLSSNSIDHFFEATACGDEVARSKPAPDVYQLALQRLNLTPEQCIALEDSYSGLTSAKAAGLYAVFIPNHYTACHDSSQADFVAEGMEQAIDHIRARFPELNPI